VIGGGAPGLPGIMQGHTDRFAFGRTNFHIDQQDLFILELDPADPERYRHDGSWKRFKRVEVAIPATYNARLETGTVNGGMEIGFPVTVQGKINRRLTTQLGSGGPLVRVTTTNGGVTLRRR